MATTAAVIGIISALAGAYSASKQSGGGVSAAKLRELTAPFGSSKIQKFLPLQLRTGAKGGMLDQLLNSGIGGILELLKRPGGLSGKVSEAILPRLAMESETIGQNFRGIRSNQAGAAARGNVPVSIRTALESALDVAQERAQRGARRDALVDSEQLRRQDLSQTFDILNAVLSFISSGRGQAGPAIQASAQAASQNQAANLAFLGTLATAFSNPDLYRQKR